MLQNGAWHQYVSAPRAGIATFGGSARPTENVSHNMGHHSDSIAISRDLGPPSMSCLHALEWLQLVDACCFCALHSRVVCEDCEGEMTRVQIKIMWLALFSLILPSM